MENIEENNQNMHQEGEEELDKNQSNQEPQEDQEEEMNNVQDEDSELMYIYEWVDSIIKAEPLAIEKLLQRVYAVLQNKINMGINPNKDQSNFAMQKNNIDILRKTLEEKDNIIKQLKDIVEVLELKLKNSEEMEGILQNKVQQLTEALNKDGINADK